MKVQVSSEGSVPTRRALARDALAVCLLWALIIAFFWRIALAGRVLAGGDIFTYFYPYWSEATRALRAGRLPLWNPYLFMGVPFLGNSQAGVLYPLNWPLWLTLPAHQSVHLSPVFHLCLAALNAYLLGRLSLDMGRVGAWATGLVYALGGYMVAQVEHVNQLQGLSWLPLAMLFSDCSILARRKANWGSVAALAGLSGVIGLTFLAGHVQTGFISLVGIAVYSLAPAVSDAWRERSPACLIRPVVVLTLAAGLGVGLAAAQLVPTWELSQLSIRADGLPMKERVSFSLSPFYLARALLPRFVSPVSPAHLEHVAYVGVSGLALVAVAILEKRGGAHRMPMALAFVGLGLFFSLGAYNPVYYVLARFVPGFAHFRVPARWLALYVLGAAMMAGWGARCLWQGCVRLSGRGLALCVLVALGLVGWGVVGVRVGEGGVVGWPQALVWLGAIAAAVGLVIAARRAPKVGTAVLLIMLAVELFVAGATLPHSRATAPQAFTSLRPAISHLLAGPAGRFISLSDITFDPGDLGEINVIYGPQLTPEALYDYIVAAKHKEMLTPNLPLAFGVLAVDGYDGGVLPLARFVKLQELFSASDRISLDGRLRENLADVPDGRWLSLFNVRYVITDKLRDAWADDVFYDLQFGAELGPGDGAAVAHVPRLESTALGVISYLRGAADVRDGAPVGEIEIWFEGGATRSYRLLAGKHTAEGAYGADVAHRQADVAVAFSTPDQTRYDYVTRLRWTEPSQPIEVRIRATLRAGELVVRGLSLVDERTGSFQSLVVSNRGRFQLTHSGDVKIYENLDVLPRAFVVRDSVLAVDDEAALVAMASPTFDPAATVVMSSDASWSPGGDGEVGECGDGSDEVLIQNDAPELIKLSVVTCSPGYLVLTSAYYPGWEVTVDGRAATLHRADLLFSAVPLEAGRHEVVYAFKPVSVRVGAAVSVAALACIAGLSLTVLLCPKVRGML